jgi:hypothetical protein
LASVRCGSGATSPAQAGRQIWHPDEISFPQSPSFPAATAGQMRHRGESVGGQAVLGFCGSDDGVLWGC